MTGAASARLRQTGFTLLEMLVTLVIVSLVAGVVWQAMGQLQRVEGLLTAGRFEAVEQSIRAEWVRSALTALLPGDERRGDRLAGSALELTGLSADVPAWPAPGVAPLHLRLEHSASDDQTSLLLVPPEAAGAAPGTAASLLRWPGRTGRFSYLGHDSQWHDRWPPEGLQKAPALPRAVLLETGVPGLAVVLAPVPTSPTPLPSRLFLEGL